MRPGPFAGSFPVSASPAKFLRRIRPDPTIVSARRAQFLQHPGHQAIGLEVMAEVEVVRPDVDEARLAVIGQGAVILLPDAKPQRQRAPRAGGTVHRAHEMPGKTATVMRGVDIET